MIEGGILYLTPSLGYLLYILLHCYYNYDCYLFIYRFIQLYIFFSIFACLYVLFIYSFIDLFDYLLICLLVCSFFFSESATDGFGEDSSLQWIPLK